MVKVEWSRVEWRRKILRTNKLQIVVHTACWMTEGRDSKASSSLTSYFLFPSFLMSNNIANNKLFFYIIRIWLLLGAFSSSAFAFAFTVLSLVSHFQFVLQGKEETAKKQRNKQKNENLFVTPKAFQCVLRFLPLFFWEQKALKTIKSNFTANK